MGILVLIVGLGTFLLAHKSASDIIQTNYENRGVEGVAADDALAGAAGKGSYSDYLTEQNRTSGMWCAAIGISVAIVGYRLYNSKK